MNYQKHGKVVAVAALFLTAILLSGCGGSSGPLPSESLLPEGTGSLEITIEQAGAAGRFVPPNTLSIKGFVYVGGTQDPNAFQISGTANLPAALALSNIPAGRKDIRVWAYDALNGAGNAVAYGVAQILLLGGRNNNVTVHLEAGRLIFVSLRDGNAELYRATPDGRLTTRLTYSATETRYPAPSPNGQKIAYSELVGGDWEIRVLDNATLAVSTFADLAGDDQFPAWSPSDSNTIIWVNNNSGTYTLHKKNLDGSGATSVSFGTTPIMRPTWSPDESRIAFMWWDGDWEIAVLWSTLALFSPFTALTSDSVSQVYPVWSRSGSGIYCSQEDFGGNYQLAELTGSLVPGGSAPVHSITNEPWHHYLWDISPDGALLACYANPPWPVIGNWDVYYYTPSSYSGIPGTRVTYNSAIDETPAFLPPTTGGGLVGYE